ncbi:PfkB family carbohydrate kinase [Acidisoma sp. L85]|jgi:ribokinase|uniref:PfkB family carbohydrate kinase n=1 Tax=Acidisoma sp. L85 TaxID=1641850 RepID=UPI00131BD2F6|nr:PfkB family carbohydrate kinase [Acidisoma sp. L85]
MLNVARLADVSVGTVFNVLNNTVPVRAVTREKVEAAIRTLNFQPTTLTLPPIKHVDPLVHAQNVNVPQLIVVGAASVDYTATLSVLPHRNDRSTARSIEKSLGGPAANTAAFAAALTDQFPVGTELVTTLGDDADSYWALAELARKNVGTAAVRRQVNQRISRCIVLVEKNGSRTILNEPVVLLESDLSPYLRRVTKRERCLHVDGSQVDHMLKMVLDIGRTGAILSLQMTDLPTVSQTANHLATLIRHFDLVFLNRDVVQEATQCRGGLTPVVEATLSLVRGARPKGIMILTLGEDGALVIFPDRREPTHVPGLVAHVIDTTGAGDAFTGAFLSVWLNTRDAVQAARYGNAAGAFAVSVEGTQNSVPTAGLLKRLLEVAVKAPLDLDGVLRYRRVDNPLRV